MPLAVMMEMRHAAKRVVSSNRPVEGVVHRVSGGSLNRSRPDNLSREISCIPESLIRRTSNLLTPFSPSF